ALASHPSFLFNPPPPPAIPTLSLHDALPIFRTLQVAQERDRPAGVVGRLPHRLRCGAMCLRVAVREVESRDIHAGLDHRPHQLRSEEHTSELQSRGHLVCRLLLEKKKQTKTQ